VVDSEVLTIFGAAAGIHFAAAEMLQVQVQVAEPHIADALGLGVHDLFGDDSRLFVAGTRTLQRIKAEGFNLIEGEYRHGGLLDSALIVSKSSVTCRAS
jgi:hypothetical protein